MVLQSAWGTTTMTHLQTVTSYRLTKDGALEAKAKFPVQRGTILDPTKDLNGYFYPLADQVKPPNWEVSVQLLLVPGQTVGLSAAHPAGILFIEINSSTYALTFGHAWAQLDDSWLDVNFGLRVALNSIPKSSLTELKAEQIFASWHLASERSPNPTNFDKFNVESDRDLVHAVEGNPEAKIAAKLGRKIRGSTGLKVMVDFLKLREAFDLIDQLQTDKKYQLHWPEIDNITVVTDPAVVLALDASLDNKLTSAHPTAITNEIILVAPSSKRTEAPLPTSYLIGRRPRTGTNGPVIEPYLMIGNWLAYLNKHTKPCNVQSARDTTVHFLDENNEPITQKNIYQCMGFETSLPTANGSDTYILSSGSWYYASASFIKNINSEISSLSLPSIPLPKWNQTDDEGDFNKACAASSPDLYLFDAKNIHFGGGQSKFEFCDIFHAPTKTFYFVKHVGASNHFSHLAEQARRTHELVFGIDDGFRTKLLLRIATLYPSMNVDWLKNGRPAPSDFNFCLVSMGKHYSKFPFFAKCGLSRVTRELRQANHNVSFLEV
jgi:uncharacterized protein (TIGR04141 family)